MFHSLFPQSIWACVNYSNWKQHKLIYWFTADIFRCYKWLKLEKNLLFGLFSSRMSLRSPQCTLPIKLSILGLTLLITVLWVLLLDLGGWRSASYWYQDLSLKPIYRGSASRNYSSIWHFQMYTSIPPFERALALSGDARCPSGFYSMEELRPHIERPQEDPEGPGADGKPFVTGILTPAELREKQEGLSRNGFNQFASDRISFHRSLGVDTRPPEWVPQEADWAKLFIFYLLIM